MKGSRNLITDVPGLLVGCATDERARTGVTVVLPEEPAICAVALYRRRVRANRRRLSGTSMLAKAERR